MNKLVLGQYLVDKKDEKIVAQVVDEYEKFYLVEVNAVAGNYVESIFKHNWKTDETRWRLL